MKRLQGKVALITGASSGIGRASAKLFANEGATLGLMDIKTDEGEQIAAEITAAGGMAKFLNVDVTDGGRIETAVETFATDFGGIDILYNNAGGATPRDDHLLNMPLDEFDAAIALNLFGPFAACRSVIPHMAMRGGGSIINTASIRSMIGTVGADGYTSAKGGIVTLTMALAVQCAPKGIRVNAIGPGLIRTPLNAENRANTDMESRFVAQTPLRRAGEAEDIAGPAIFLASDMSDFVTGAYVPVDGGYLTL